MQYSLSLLCLVLALVAHVRPLSGWAVRPGLVARSARHVPRSVVYCSGEDAAEEAKEDAGEKVDDILNTPIFLKRKLEVLEKEKETLEAELEEKKNAAAGDDEWKDKIARLEKEFKTLRDRAVNEMTVAKTNAVVDVLKDMLGVTDNFARAKATITSDSPATQEVVARYDQLYDSIQAVFGELGMEPVATVGEPFDPNSMEAVMMQPSDEHEDGVVIQEFQQGFKVGDKMVRPAFVVVSSG